MPQMRNRVREADDKWVIWQVPETGDPEAPYDDPVANMDMVRFCSDFQYLNDALTVEAISVTHQTVAGVTGTGYAPPSQPNGQTGAVANGQILIQTQTLYTHSLGYVPRFQVRYGGNIVFPGTVVQQVVADKTIRLVSCYATSSIIGIKNIGISNTVALASQATEYDLTIFRQPAKQAGEPLVHVKGDGSVLVIGHGRITSEHRPMRRLLAGAGEPEYLLPFGTAKDVWKGVVRAVQVDGNKDHGGTYVGSLINAAYIGVTFG